jgi:hypothetical protein
MVPPLICFVLACTRFPRLRGDGPAPRREKPELRRVPPPTRGWSPVPIPPGPPHAGSPAYAGMVPGPRRRPVITRRFPRLRGDGPGDAKIRQRYRQVPPLRGDGPRGLIVAIVAAVVPPPTRGNSGTCAPSCASVEASGGGHRLPQWGGPMRCNGDKTSKKWRQPTLNKQKKGIWRSVLGCT